MAVLLAEKDSLRLDILKDLLEFGAGGAVPHKGVEGFHRKLRLVEEQLKEVGNGYRRRRG